MAKVKLLKAGFENYTGVIGTFQFEDGISEEMSKADADRMSASITCGLVQEDGSVDSLSPLDNMKTLRKQKIANNPESRRIKTDEDGDKSDADKSDADREPAKVQEQPGYDFTAESLEALIKEGGIKALREVADKYDVRGTQIAAIYSDLLAKKAAYEKLTAEK